MSEARRRIWEMECGLLDAVLALSFEPAELANLCQGEPSSPGCTCAARAVIRFAHARCHEPTPLARLLERNLDVLHRRELERLAAAGLEEYGEALVTADLWAVPELAGRLWAVLRCEHPLGDELRRYLVGALSLDGLRLFAAEAGRPGWFEADRRSASR